jgi:hypothetical protein
MNIGGSLLLDLLPTYFASTLAENHTIRIGHIPLRCLISSVFQGFSIVSGLNAEC